MASCCPVENEEQAKETWNSARGPFPVAFVPHLDKNNSRAVSRKYPQSAVVSLTAKTWWINTVAKAAESCGHSSSACGVTLPLFVRGISDRASPVALPSNNKIELKFPVRAYVVVLSFPNKKSELWEKS